MSTRLLLVDDHEILLDGIKSLIDKYEDFEVVASATSATRALELLEEKTVDIVVTDLSMPEMDGLQLIREIRKIQPEQKIIVLSLHEDIHRVKAVLKLGVKGYIVKSESGKELLFALQRVAASKTFVSEQINRMLVEQLNKHDTGSLLTAREIEILKLITQELTNKQIAEELFISERTVETHRKNIYQKAGTNNLVGLIKFAYENQIL